MFTTARLERGYLQLALAAPIFGMLVALAAQAGLLTAPMRELTMLCMATSAIWCLFVRGMPQFAHISLFAFGVLFSGLAFGLDRQGLADFAPRLLVAPQVLRLGASVQGVSQALRERA